MHNKQKLKRLAYIAAANDSVPTDIEHFVLTCLSKLELKTFLFYYKSALSKNHVYVTSAAKITNNNLDLIKKKYADMKIVTLLDEELGAGIKLQHDDLVVDFTFKNYINDTVEKLKN